MKMAYLQSKLRRVQTLFNSLKAVYHLTPEQVNNFIKAYDTYECDWVDGEAVKNGKKVDYNQVVENLLNWYSVLNHICSIGVVEKMYIPPIFDTKASFTDNQILYEKNFTRWLDIKKGNNVLELGCGRGRISAHVATLTGAKITGINIDDVQLNSAITFSEKTNLSQQCQFIKRDFNDLPFPFPDNYFDAAYEVQALSYSRDLEKLFRELHRVMKPGGKLCLCAEWVRLPPYDSKNARHLELMRRAKIQVGAIGTPSPEEYESALRNAGFNVLMSKDPSIAKSEILVKKAGSSFDRFYPLFKFLIKIKLIPKHFVLLFDEIGKNTDALREADDLGLVSMNYHFTAQKPTDI
jgi:sterol 24-C-methyltransferase